MTKENSSNNEDITPNITNNPTHDTDSKDIVRSIMSYEQGDMEDDEMVSFFQQLIDTGRAWTLQGHYGRTAKYLIDIGVCNEAVSRHE